MILFTLIRRQPVKETETCHTESKVYMHFISNNWIPFNIFIQIRPVFIQKLFHCYYEK